MTTLVAENLAAEVVPVLISDVVSLHTVAQNYDWGRVAADSEVGQNSSQTAPALQQAISTPATLRPR